MAAITQTALRADARRNRDRIVASARELFALRGEQAHMGDIARHAGVGKGSLYRHFPDKEALVIEVVQARLEELCEIASRAEDIEDPCEAVEAALRTILYAIEGDTGLQVAMTRCGDLHWEGIAQQKAAFAAIVTRIVKRAQAAGGIRSDLDFDDVLMVLSGIIATMYFKPSAAAWQRHLQLILAGFAPHGVRPTRRRDTCP